MSGFGLYRCVMAIGAEVESVLRGKFDSLLPYLDERQQPCASADAPAY
jgi:hypothetical protein